MNKRLHCERETKSGTITLSRNGLGCNFAGRAQTGLLVHRNENLQKPMAYGKRYQLTRRSMPESEIYRFVMRKRRSTETFGGTTVPHTRGHKPGKGFAVPRLAHLPKGFSQPSFGGGTGEAALFYPIIYIASKRCRRSIIPQNNRLACGAIFINKHAFLHRKTTPGATKATNHY